MAVHEIEESRLQYSLQIKEEEEKGVVWKTNAIGECICGQFV
jgi:hypothetical protein